MNDEGSTVREIEHPSFLMDCFLGSCQIGKISLMPWHGWHGDEISD